MERNEENGIQIEEDDDFEDFGGFEAAEPVLPNVAQASLGLASGVQATPNPWAVFPSGNVSVQPDLLCGQNRFPAHLDTPTTLDVASGAVGGVENGEPGVDGSAERANGLFDVEQDLTNNLDSVELDLDQINLANDILDGSFRTSSSQSGSSFLSHGREQLPDISALDLGLSFEHRSANSPEVVNPSGANSETIGDVEVRLVSSAGSQQNSVPADGRQSGQVGGISTNETTGSLSGGAVGGASEEVNERIEPKSHDSQRSDTGSAEADSMRKLLEQAIIDQQTVQKELEDQRVFNTKLEDDLQRARELAETTQSQYEKLQEEHNKQLDELRQAGHQTLTVVVEEYKDLLKSTVLHQQEDWNRQLSERLKEESERFTDILQEQSEKFSTMQKEERQKNEDRMKEAVEEMKEKEQVLFEKELCEERKKTEERIAEAIQKERDKSKEEIERVIEEERSKAQHLLEEQQEKLKSRLSEEVNKTQEALQEALMKERQKCKEDLDNMLGEERKQSQEVVKHSVAATREEMKEYLKEQRKRDNLLHQRHLASLDLFLESARSQLKLLMDNSSEQKDDQVENS